MTPRWPSAVFVVAVGVGGFWLTRIVRTAATVSLESAAETTISDTSLQHSFTPRERLRNAKSAAPPRTITPLTRAAADGEWEHLVDESWEEMSTTKNALIMAMARSRYEQGKSHYECNPNGDLVGTFTLEFRTDIESTADEFRASALRFVAVRDGSPLPHQVVECFEQLLGGPYVVKRANNEPAFLAYKGPFPIEYRFSFDDSRNVTDPGI